MNFGPVLYTCLTFVFLQGLETAVKGSMPKLSLVSNGCEIIRVSMSKFREYSDNATHSKAEDMFTKCPSDFTLWNSFKKQNHWNNFKNGVVTDVLYDAHLHNSLNHSSGSQAGAGMVSRDISTAGSNRRKAADLVRQKNTSRISYATNPFPKISFSAGAWVDNRASSNSRSKYNKQPFLDVRCNKVKNPQHQHCILMIDIKLWSEAINIHCATLKLDVVSL